MTKLSYYIVERHNPQLDKPYYMACGQLTKKAAKKKETPLYGYNDVLEYATEAEYNAAIEKYKADGFRVTP